MLPDLPSLRLLADVARHSSIGAAGRGAGMSQQSASERLRAMEAQTGLVLVQRSKSGSTLTAAGRLLVEWSARLLEQAEEVELALRTLRQARSEELHVFASMTTAEYLLPRWLVRLRQQRQVTVGLHATNSEAVLQAVRSGEAGLGFVEGPGDLSGLASKVVGHDELVLVADPTDIWACQTHHRHQRSLRKNQQLGVPQVRAERAVGFDGDWSHTHIGYEGALARWSPPPVGSCTRGGMTRETPRPAADSSPQRTLIAATDRTRW